LWEWAECAACRTLIWAAASTEQDQSMSKEHDDLMKIWRRGLDLFRASVVYAWSASRATLSRSKGGLSECAFSTIVTWLLCARVSECQVWCQTIVCSLCETMQQICSILSQSHSEHWLLHDRNCHGTWLT
jgi:hypothetical protein